MACSACQKIRSDLAAAIRDADLAEAAKIAAKGTAALAKDIARRTAPPPSVIRNLRKR